MLEKIDGDYNTRIEPSDWRWSAAIVGLIKYFEKYGVNYNEKDDCIDCIEFDEKDITKEKYLEFVELYFLESMHHKTLERLLDEKPKNEKIIKDINNTLSANAVMKKIFSGIKFQIDDEKKIKEIKEIIKKNRYELIEETFKNGKKLYSNFADLGNKEILKEELEICRLLGYKEDMGRKSKTIAYGMNKNSLNYTDSKYFDFIPFAFSKTRESFFINCNYNIKNLVKYNTYDLMDKTEDLIRSQIFFKTKKSANFIDFDVEIIIKEREEHYFKTLYLRNEAIKIFNEIDEQTQNNIEKSVQIGNNCISIEKEATNAVINNIKLDNLIEMLIKQKKESDNFFFLVKSLIEINILIYTKGVDKMNDKQKSAYASAKKINDVLKDKPNKLRAYEQKLISAISLKDYEKVQEIILHLSSYTQIKIDIAIDLFEDFEKNKNLAYTFINNLGEKK